MTQTSRRRVAAARSARADRGGHPRALSPSSLSGAVDLMKDEDANRLTVVGLALTPRRRRRLLPVLGDGPAGRPPPGPRPRERPALRVRGPGAGPAGRVPRLPRGQHHPDQLQGRAGRGLRGPRQLQASCSPTRACSARCGTRPVGSSSSRSSG